MFIEWSHFIYFTEPVDNKKLSSLQHTPIKQRADIDS